MLVGCRYDQGWVHCVALQVLRRRRTALRRWRRWVRVVEGRGCGVEGWVMWERVGSSGGGVEAFWVEGGEVKLKGEEWFVG